MVGERLEPAPGPTSPVLSAWLMAWKDIVGPNCAALHHYMDRLPGSGGTPTQEIARQWLVVDWLVREAAPMWLRAAWLDAPADALAALPPLASPRELEAVAGTVCGVARIARTAHTASWWAVANMVESRMPEARLGVPVRPASPATGGPSGPAGGRPAGSWPGSSPGGASGSPSGASAAERWGRALPSGAPTWAALVNGAVDGLHHVASALVPAWRAIGYEPGASPPAWRGATNVVVDAAGVVACAAVERLVTDPTWSWRTPPADADAVARMAARASLRRVEGRYRRSTRPLVERILAVTASPVPA